jgi:ribosomal protein S27E
VPYLHCPRCHRSAWTQATADYDVACRHCGTTLTAVSRAQLNALTGAVRERFARDARLNVGRPRFIRERR